MHAFSHQRDRERKCCVSRKRRLPHTPHPLFFVLHVDGCALVSAPRSVSCWTTASGLSVQRTPSSSSAACSLSRPLRPRHARCMHLAGFPCDLHYRSSSWAARAQPRGVHLSFGGERFYFMWPAAPRACHLPHRGCTTPLKLVACVCMRFFVPRCSVPWTISS